MNTRNIDQNPDDLQLSSYHFDLPQDLIAQRPASESRLLVYKVSTNEVIHDYFKNIGSYLPSDTLLVFNRSKVFASRLLGNKESGGKAEIFLLSTTKEIMGDQKDVYPALIKTSSKKKMGDQFFFKPNLIATLRVINTDGTFGVSFNTEDLISFLEAYAKIPIPPYIRNGESDEADKINYQTVYAKEVGSVAAPTAGLHFTNDLLSKLAKQNIQTAFVTLHVGLGTFRPVSTSLLKDHQMHSENFFIDKLNDELIFKARSEKKKIFAVGTTSLRVLESSFEKNLESDTIYSTKIFLHPGVEIKSVDGLITNFHLPESTLLMLVSAMIGRLKALELYQIAIDERYRFFSYGDGMLIIR
ncbi:MAG: tRNA preQ1(34) S-adenosylmethionine ribosyltransferase-isomerase QueA [Bacteriovorax sp.]|nr:tRNA preQ1(34) S-adenosylmethionine ribosyltransferase-isomerase QueA [Bacteriovorax sp.]